jgi:hypothetical protein
MFKDGRKDVHDEEWSGQPFVVSDDLVHRVDQKICERWHFSISELSCEFPQNTLTLLYEIITVRLGCHRCSQNAESGLIFEFLGRYHNDGDKFRKHITWLTGGETSVSFVNVETKEQSKQWMHTRSPNKPKKFKQTSTCQQADGSCFMRQERSADGGIHAARDHNNIRSVLRNTKKTA